MVQVYDEHSLVVTDKRIYNTDTRGWWTAERLPISDIATYRGQQLRVSIWATGDEQLPTSFFVDKVWLVFGCGIPLSTGDNLTATHGNP